MSQTVNMVICGAGSPGVAAAYYLAKEKGIGNLLIVDKHPLLTQTSAKSGENYRNWWPNSVMAQLMNRSNVALSIFEPYDYRKFFLVAASEQRLRRESVFHL